MIVRRELAVFAAALIGTIAAGAPAHAGGPAGAEKTAAVSGSAAPARGSAAAEPTRAERALDLFRQANKLYDQRKLPAAEALYRRALELQQTYDIASNFGALELDLGKPAAAAELFALALRHYPVAGKPAERAGIEARFEQAKKLVCTLRVKVAGAGAEILIDGRSVGVAPLVADLYVEPGSRTIEARQAGRRDAREILRAAAGTTREVRLTLEPLSEPARRGPLPGIVMGAAGVVALGAGATLVGLAESTRAEAQGKHDALATSGASCAVPSSECAELHALTSRTDALGNAGIAALVAGGALVAVGLTYTLWPSSAGGAKAREATLGLSISASPAGGGATLIGSF